MFKFAKTEMTCFTLKSHPSETEIGLLPEPHKFVEGHITFQRLYVVFEFVFKQKYTYTKIKQEPEENPTKTEGMNHKLNKRTTLLIEQAERIANLLSKQNSPHPSLRSSNPSGDKIGRLNPFIIVWHATGTITSGN
jgi:hypothetical protein